MAGVSRPACEACLDTGYCGRTACGQVVVVTEALRQTILRHPSASELREAIARGPEAARPAASLYEDGLRLVRAGVTTLDELRRVTGATDGGAENGPDA